MTGEEQQLLENYLAHLNILGEEGTHPDLETWYQEVRYARGRSAPRTLREVSELRFKPQSTEEMSVAAWLRGKKVLL